MKTELKQQAIQGIKTAAVDEATDALLTVAQRLLGDKLGNVLDHPLGVHAAKTGVAVLLQLLSESVDLGISKKAIQELCGLQIQATVRDLVQPHLREIRAALQSVQGLRGGAE